MKLIKIFLYLLLTSLESISIADFNDGMAAHDRGDYKAAIKEWKPLAKQGDVDAQIQLAFLYILGKGVDRDVEQGIAWFRKAAEQDHVDAYYTLGLAYETGIGVPIKIDKAIDWYKKAAKKGDEGAKTKLKKLLLTQNKNTELSSKTKSASEQYNLGLDYFYGKNDVEENKKIAFNWFYKSAKKGHIKAQRQIGWMYANGSGVAENKKKSTKWYRKSADQGYATAQTNLATAYRWGYGVDKDYSQALYWTKKAANQNDAKSLNNLALMYKYGLGDIIEKNYKKSIHYFLKAIGGKGESKAKNNLKKLLVEINYNSDPIYSEAVKEYEKKIYDKAFPKFLYLALEGNIKAQTYTGLMFDNGQWIEKDYIQALKWYKKAASQNYDIAQYNLALLYEYGRGVDKDIDQALKWYKKSAAQGDKDAKVKVKKLLALQNSELIPTLSEAIRDYDEEDYYSAFPKFLKLANQGNAEAQSFLGWMYRKGWGTVKNNKAAFKWFYKLSTQDSDWSMWAQNQLGSMYSIGEGVDKNIYKAVKWYRKAAEDGYDLAQYNLALKYEYGTGVEKNITTALKWYRKSADQGDEDAKDKVKELLALQGQDGQTNKYTVFSGSGTGFVVSKDGVVATNHHVIDNCGRIVVDGKNAKLVLQDKVNDLALIKVDITYDKVSHLSYRSPTLGSDVSVFGYPLSDMMSEKHISLTKGSVSSLAGMDGNLSNFRFTAPVQPGNSGGPIVNKKGKVVGITRAVLGKTVLEKGDFLPQNVNFGIRSSLLINMMESKMISVNDTPLKVEDIVKHYVKTTKYIKCYE